MEAEKHDTVVYRFQRLGHAISQEFSGIKQHAGNPTKNYVYIRLSSIIIKFTSTHDLLLAHQ